MVYGRLSTEEQWHLHHYFVPSEEYSNEELLAHRVESTRFRNLLLRQLAGGWASSDSLPFQVVTDGRRMDAKAPGQSGHGHALFVRFDQLCDGFSC
jgi:hypothetical protein